MLRCQWIVVYRVSERCAWHANNKNWYAHNSSSYTFFFSPRIHIYYTNSHRRFILFHYYLCKIYAVILPGIHPSVSWRIACRCTVRVHISIDEMSATNMHSPKCTPHVLHGHTVFAPKKKNKLISFKWHKLLARTDDKYIFLHFCFSVFPLSHSLSIIRSAVARAISEIYF